MTDLSLLCGLPIQLDEDNNNIFYGESVTFEKQIDIPLTEITPILLNKFLRYPEKVYKQYTNVSVGINPNLGKKVSYHVVQIPYGLLGIEYVKTHIYFSKYVKNKFDCIVQLVRGEITVLVQRNSEPEEEYTPSTFVDEIDIIKLEAGDKLAIPTGVFYTFVNTGNQLAIFAIVASKNYGPVDYTTLQKEKGLAFYIISKNARLEVVANPKYKLKCKACQKAFRELAENEKIKYIHELITDIEEPLYNLLKNKFKKVEAIIRS